MSQIKVKLSFDYLNSLLVCYHILCCPEKKFENSNKEVYTNFKVTKLQVNRYNKYIESLGYKSKQDKEMYRLRVFTPKLRTLKEYIERKGINKQLEKDLLRFEKLFIPYFKKQGKLLNKIIKGKQKVCEKSIPKIYSKVKSISGIKIKSYSKIDIRVLDGLSPTSFARDYNDVQYIIEQKNIILREDEFFYLTLVHELVSHQSIEQFRHYYEDIFGKHIYEVEEGFAKLFAEKVLSSIFKNGLKHSVNVELERQAYNIYENNWHKLTNKNFESWYVNCLKEIKKKL